MKIPLFQCALISGMIALSGCQVTYLLKSGIGQTNLLRKRIPIETLLGKPDLDPVKKAKLLLVQDVRKFAEDQLGLKTTKNYTTFVELDRPYVSWTVSAAPKWEMKHHLFWFPVVGSLPYKGYFSEDDAKAEAEELKLQDMDISVRGVSAYSTLGWTSDPILSSMLKMEDHDLVELIIHETVHTTLYISSAADFNERLASFIGELGAKKYYESKRDHARIEKIQESSHDTKIFSEFISGEIKKLEAQYNAKSIPSESDRQLAFEGIKERFKTEALPKMSSNAFQGFLNRPLNNAVLLGYKTYWMDLSDFEAAFERQGRNFPKFLAFCKTLENEKDPEAAIRK
ncbi:MAG: aminopeptidase [Bdellovibrionales bacterium]|nr:aminopeptidase [Bdellovibrionales bacterium]